MIDDWKLPAFSLATTMAVAYVGCAVFDALFPPFGMLVAFAPHSPWPLFGTPLGYLTGFVTSIVAGFVIGALYSFSRQFWSRVLT